MPARSGFACNMFCAALNASARVMPGCIATILDRKSTRLNSSHQIISYAVFCLKKKKTHVTSLTHITPHAALCLKKKQKHAELARSYASDRSQYDALTDVRRSGPMLTETILKH